MTTKAVWMVAASWRLSSSSCCLSSSTHGTMKLVDHVVRSFRVAKLFRDNTEKINNIDFSPSGDLLVTSSDDDQIVIYDCEKGTWVSPRPGLGVRGLNKALRSSWSRGCPGEGSVSLSWCIAGRGVASALSFYVGYDFLLLPLLSLSFWPFLWVLRGHV